MPRKTKEQNQIEKGNIKEEDVKKSSAKKAEKTSVAKKSKTKKPETSKKTTATKKSTKASTTKKASSTKTSAKKSTTSSSPKTSTKRTSRKKVEIVEYYDLPYRYNQTIVKLLAQTPTNLFVYWDISDADRKIFQKQYGDNFFNVTRPILIVHNDTMGYSFEVEINDFANSWYLHVNDSKCNYRIELGRRPIQNTEKLTTSDYIYVTTSNKIESPNNRILFDKNQKKVYFRNVKTGYQTQKEVTSISFIRNMGKIYNIYDLYKAIYKNENIEEIYDLSNPSSGNPSSTTNPSSNFKTF